MAATPASIKYDVPSADEAVFIPGGQYTATLDQTQNVWRFLPMNGQDVVVDAGTCSNGAMAPTGVWLLQLDRQGRPELVAPSVTKLAGASSSVTIMCSSTW